MSHPRAGENRQSFDEDAKIGCDVLCSLGAAEAKSEKPKKPCPSKQFQLPMFLSSTSSLGASFWAGGVPLRSFDSQTTSNLTLLAQKPTT